MIYDEKAVTGQECDPLGVYTFAWSDPIDYPTREIMDFHLVYAGNLLKSGRSGHVWEKHQIRRYLHPQLKKLWETHPLLSFYSQDVHWARHGEANCN